MTQEKQLIVRLVDESKASKEEKDFAQLLNASEPLTAALPVGIKPEGEVARFAVQFMRKYCAVDLAGCPPIDLDSPEIHKIEFKNGEIICTPMASPVEDLNSYGVSFSVTGSANQSRIVIGLADQGSAE